MSRESFKSLIGLERWAGMTVAVSGRFPPTARRNPRCARRHVIQSRRAKRFTDNRQLVAHLDGGKDDKHPSRYCTTRQLGSLVLVIIGDGPGFSIVASRRIPRISVFGRMKRANFRAASPRQSIPQARDMAARTIAVLVAGAWIRQRVNHYFGICLQE
ncbi:hypothetical protein NCS56_00300800 [Fusarium sp. Ph1]|nr:hypothetical protein NCS56_00300800 [Fusarium sp. Ph1]